MFAGRGSPECTDGTALQDDGYKQSRKMHILLSLLFFFVGPSSAKPEGDFGIFTACTVKNNLRLNCHYANCSGPYPSFSCKFMAANGSLLAQATNEKCRHVLHNHRLHYSNTTTHYRCVLIRKKRREEKNITINYSVCRGKNCIKPCHNTLGRWLHQGPAALWPVAVVLSLWTILSAKLEGVVKW